MKKIKYYKLVNTSDRELSLIRFEEVIKEAYRIVCPSVKVKVYDSYYTVTGEISPGQLRSAGRYIAKNRLLGSCCVSYKNTNQIFRCYKEEEV